MMPTPLYESFIVEGPTGVLVRRVEPRRGQPYEHICTKAVLEDVASAIDCLEGAAFTIESIIQVISGGVAARTPPFTQVAVAVAFLKERGCVAPARQRKHAAATDDVYLDAMTEYHALREGG
ncbi:MAG: hypothetical protein IT430_17245 [Phycisphaerales bacterium]|nr:hypothetical protein [Phycisphaerales bacterium]